MRARSTAAAALLLALPLLLLLWRAAPEASPPLYDGVCLAAPYVSVGHSPGPSSASQRFPADPNPDTFNPTEVVTTENPPQAQLLLQMSSLQSGTPFTISITPLLPAPAAPPSGWALDGNVYRILATDSAGQQLQPLPQTPATVLLRATASNPPKTMFILEGGAWTQLKTYNAGCGDTFEAVSTKLGNFALFTQTTTAPPATSGGGGAPVVPIVIALVVVVVLTVAGLFFLNRPRRA